VWQTVTSSPTFKWTIPQTVAPFERFNINWCDDDGKIVESSYILNENVSVEYTPTTTISSGSKYRLSIFPRKATGATPTGEAVPVFRFRYGETPVDPVSNISITAENAKLTVSWTNPVDTNFDSARIYWRALNEISWQGGGSQKGLPVYLENR
jgi:hypothetical protein